MFGADRKGGWTTSETYGDSGSAARFYYCAKASRAEREAGCWDVPPKKRDDTREEGSPGGDNPRNRGAKPIHNSHPTVKPIALMRYPLETHNPA